MFGNAEVIAAHPLLFDALATISGSAGTELDRLGVAAALHQNVKDEPSRSTARQSQCFLLRIETTAASRCRLSPSRPDVCRRMSLVKACPNFSAQSRAVSCVTMISRAASMSSTDHGLS